jgi:lactoylglutathione lyase
MPPVVSKFLHTRMRVDDLDRTVAFYEEVFGLEVSRRHESPRGSKLVFLSVPNSDEEIEITYYPGSGPVKVQEDLMHLAFEVESMDSFAKHIRQVGYSFSDGPTQSSSGSVFAFVDAPEGYEVEVIEKPKNP